MGGLKGEKNLRVILYRFLEKAMQKLFTQGFIWKHQIKNVTISP